MIDELSIIARYFRPLAGEGSFGLTDDAARLRVPPGQELVVTADTIAAGVHFLAADPADTIARKALRVNISDLAAKGAQPLGYVLSAGFSPFLEEGWLAAFCDGLQADQEEFGIALLGGDTVVLPAGAPVLSVTAFGLVKQGAMVHRFNAKPGDELYVSGFIGDAVAGLDILTGGTGVWDGIPASGRDRLVRRYRVPEPRTALAPVLRAFAHAAMDVSDGLVGDCDKMAAASQCAARIDAGLVPISPDLRDTARDPGVLARLITGGDDYEIVAAVPPERAEEFSKAARGAGVSVTRIGDLHAGAGQTEVSFQGRPLDLSSRSYIHGGRTAGSAPAKPL